MDNNLNLKTFLDLYKQQDEIYLYSIEDILKYAKKLSKQMYKCVEVEDYEQAAECRDDIKDLKEYYDKIKQI
jgi:protein-arginine kinase activator protein McsA